MEIKNLKKAAKRILKAIKDREKIILYGDADIDGSASVIILKKSIEELGGTRVLDSVLEGVAHEFTLAEVEVFSGEVDAGFEEVSGVEFIGKGGRDNGVPFFEAVGAFDGKRGIEAAEAIVIVSVKEAIERYNVSQA